MKKLIFCLLSAGLLLHPIVYAALSEKDKEIFHIEETEFYLYLPGFLSEKKIQPLSEENKKEISIQKIIGEDDRVRITDPKNKGLPYSAIGLLLNRDLGSCTGTLIYKKHVLTAAHCVLNSKKTAVINPELILFAPAVDKKDIPYGYLNAKKIFIPKEYNNANCNFSDSMSSVDGCMYDYAIVVLEKEIVHLTGSSGVFNLKFKQLKNFIDTKIQMAITGYPEDKGKDTMWSEWNIIKSILYTNNSINSIEYSMDTMHGQSGSPVWLFKMKNYPGVIAVHIGTLKRGSNFLNFGVPITDTIFNNIVSWIKQD